MKILVIHGSPRARGNTFKVISEIEKEMKQLDPATVFEWVFLHQEKLELCRGCYLCLEFGEDRCPINDSRGAIEAQMKAADGVIFASPVYVANVSALFKNFVDRFAYISHRPRFHNKKAMVLCTTGSVAAGIVNIIMTFMLETWGFTVVQKVGAIVSPGVSEGDQIKQWEKIRGDAKKAAKRMLDALNDHALPQATFKKLYAFKLQQVGFGSAAKDKADYRYWRDNGWLDPRQVYYIPAKINPIKLFFARVLASFEMKKYPKGNG